MCSKSVLFSAIHFPSSDGSDCFLIEFGCYLNNLINVFGIRLLDIKDDLSLLSNHYGGYIFITMNTRTFKHESSDFTYSFIQNKEKKFCRKKCIK